MNDDPDWAVRAKAFDAIEHLAVQASGQIRWEDIVRGFVVDGQTVRFANRALGIFRPRQMSAALSIKTVVPRAGRASRYRDQSIDLDDPTGLLHYDLARRGLKNQTNRDLYQAYVRRAPLIYFRGRAPAVYEALWPVWVEEFSEADECVLISAHDTVNASVSSVMASGSAEQLQVEATYSLRVSRQRNHQAWFSSRTKSAYGYRCALSGLPLRNLLVGAHILPDAQGGPASVTNGICMSTLHHTAFDANLIGIDPDFRVHVAKQVREGRDGPLLDSLKRLQGASLRLPVDRSAHPDRSFLEQRFNRFVSAD